MLHAKNKGTHQPAHQHSLISAFVVRCLDRIMLVPAESKMPRLKLVSLAEQAILSLIWLYTSEDRVSCDVAQIL